jgi:hypothetical protein
MQQKTERSASRKVVDMEQAKGFIDFGSRVLFFVLTLLMAVVAFQGRQVLKTVEKNSENIGNVSERVTTIEANRYTSSDALSDNRLLAYEIKSLRTWIEENHPPDYLVKDLDELKEEVREMRRELKSRPPN